MANLWQYETIKAAQAELKDDLNRLGKLGYQVIHLKEVEAGYFVIRARSARRPIDEGEDKQDDWLVDIVTGPESHLS